MGIGQLFFFLKVLPSFRLLSSGRGGGEENNSKNNFYMWRTYLLQADGIECHIKEEFYPTLFEISVVPQQETAKL